MWQMMKTRGNTNVAKEAPMGDELMKTSRGDEMTSAWQNKHKDTRMCRQRTVRGRAHQQEQMKTSRAPSSSVQPMTKDMSGLRRGDETTPTLQRLCIMRAADSWEGQGAPTEADEGILVENNRMPRAFPCASREMSL